MESDQFTLEEKWIEVGKGHKLYAQAWGNKDAEETVVFLHGGPGSGCSQKHKALFDPQTQKVIFFDQRGCGKSLPYGSLQDNTTDDMVEDLRRVTSAFGANRFAITGGSWGSCLALTFAIRYPEQVTRMVLRGIFTGRQKEIDFVEKGGFRDFFPDVWDEYAQSAPEAFRNDPGAYHMPRMLGEDPQAAKLSAFAYSRLEGSLISLDDRTYPENYETFDPVSTIIECYYIANSCFLPDSYILDNAKKLTMPIDLVQGRYDAVCPPFTAYELAQVLPDAQLYWTTAGHSGNDRANWDLTRALLVQHKKRA